MRVRFFGGLAVTSGGQAVDVRGRGQEALLFRLALDAGTAVAYRALAEDVWPDDPPDDPRAALQSLASRLRRAVPDARVEAVPGGYRLAVAREDVDVAHFQDLVAAARQASDEIAGAELARAALALWRGDPWLPDGFDWVARDLWEDRGHAERLAAAATARPPAASASARAASASVPAALTSLVGRERELALIAAQLASERLVTLVGPGGAGKTTLALQTARASDGAIVVELAPIAAGETWNAIDGAIGRRMRISETATAPTTARERTLAALAGREVLLVLDNCEHVVAETALMVRELLEELPALRILATSREPLGVRGEAFVDLGPLPPEDAAELLSRRVRAARGFPPASEDEGVVARIVRRLDGLPLAIELAAAKARTLTLAEIEAGLDDRFRLLRVPGHAVDARHQTLRALIDWSWDTLDERERDALRAVAVFPDGVGTEDADAVARAFDVDPADFDTLVDRSLLHRAAGRFRMLETVREYGLGRLREEARLREAHRRQASVIATLALERDRASRGPAVRESVRWFDANEDNLSSATRWAATAEGDAALGVVLARAQLWVWIMRERFEEARTAIAAFGESARGLASEADVVLSSAAVGLAAAAAGEAREDAGGAGARAELEAWAEAVTAAAWRHPSEITLVIPAMLTSIVRTLSSGAGESGWSRRFDIDETAVAEAPLWTRALVAVMQAAVAQNEGDQDALEGHSERALRMFLETGDPWGVSLASHMRADWLVLHGRLAGALAVIDSAGDGMEGLASRWDLIQQRTQGVAILVRQGRIPEARARLAALEEYGRADRSDRSAYQLAAARAALELAAGDGAAALEAADRALAASADEFPQQVVAYGHVKRAQALSLLGRADEARDALRIAVPLAIRSGDQPIVAEAAVAVAAWLVAAGDPALARRAIAASDAIRGARDETDRFLQRLRAAVGDAAAPGSAPDPGAVDARSLLALLD